MKNFKRILTFVLLALVSFSGALFGCRGKYDNLKITSDKDESGLQLYLDENDMADGNDLSVGTITFTIHGANDKISKNLKFSFEGNEESKVVKITKTEVVDNSTKVTLKAISGGSTKLIALSEEGGKKASVKIQCIKKVTAMNFNSSYTPAMFNVPGNSLTINTKQISFEPADTTQNQVTYSLENNIDGVNITPAGVITLEKHVSASDITVVATNKENSSLKSVVFVHLINPLETEESDGIDIFADSDLYKDGKICLTTVGADSSLIIRADVNTTEQVSLSYRIVRENGIVDCVNVEQNGNEFYIYSNNIGDCKLVIEVKFDAYTDVPVSQKVIDVSVIELPSTISVNGINQDFSSDIYTYYQNGKGHEYIINVGDFFAYDKSFVLVADDAGAISICKNDGSKIKFGTLDSNGKIVGDYDVIQSGMTIFVSALTPNKNTNLYIYANGTLNRRQQLVRTISLKTLLGSRNVNPVYRTLDNETSKIYYVEVGKSFELEYNIDSNTSAKGIKLLNFDGSELDDVVSAEIGDGLSPTITVTALKAGTVSCKLMLENLVESENFIIYVFVPVDYEVEIDENDNEIYIGGVYYRVDSPLSNRNIAEAVYAQNGQNSSLEKFVIALGSGVQLYSSTKPSDATIINISYSSVLFQNGEEADNGSEYVSVSANGYVVARKLLPSTILQGDEEVAQEVKIKVQTTSLVTKNDGSVWTITCTKYITVEPFVPLRDVVISKKNTTIYWSSFELLNPIQKISGAYADSVSLSLYPSLITFSKARISWDCPDALMLQVSEDGAGATVMAYADDNNVPNEANYTISATVQYYSTTVVRRFIVNVVKAVRAKTLVAYVDGLDGFKEDKNVAYFEINNESNSANPSYRNIIAEVYSAQNIKNVTFDKIYFRSLDETVATVSQDGVITPVGAGKTVIHVYSQDMMTGSDIYDYVEYKAIEVIVADGLTYDSALKISTENEFEKINQNPNLYYYLSNDITFSSNHFVPVFNGNLNGKGHNINGIVLDQIEGSDYEQEGSIVGKYHSLIGEITENARISNLNLTVSLNYETNNNNVYFAGLAKTNNGFVEDVEVYYLTSNILVKTAKAINFAGAVLENNNIINNVSVSANINVNCNDDIELDELKIAGIVLVNNGGYIYGENNNYEHVAINAIQTYDFTGSINLGSGISATSSAIGGVVANNYGSVGSNSFTGGLAVDIRIDAEKIDNVGGIVGENYGKIYNVLVSADITANNNVGGIAGSLLISKNNVMGENLASTTNPASKQTQSQIVNAVVEMYDNVDGQNYGKVVGNENVGGIAGLMSGCFNIFRDNNETEDTADYYNDLSVCYNSIQYSYVYAYSNQSAIIAKNNVGGLVGKAYLAKVFASYANTKIQVTQNDGVIGGLIGLSQKTELQRAYAFVSVVDRDGKTFGSAVGEVADIVDLTSYGYTEKSSIDEFYTTLSGEQFVGTGDSFEIGAKQTFDGSYELDNIETFKNDDENIGWKIGNQIGYFDSVNSSYVTNDWFISDAENNGYPTLIYAEELMRKQQPSQIFISPKTDYYFGYVYSNELVIVDTEKIHRLSDVLNIATDVSTRATIYVYASVNGVLNTRNTTSKLTNNVSLQSLNEQVVTLTFVLGNNISVTKSIQIAFVKMPKSYQIENLKIKLGQSSNISANISYEDLSQFEPLNLENYKLKILQDALMGNENGSQVEVVSINSAEHQTINGINVLLVDNGSAVKANRVYNLSGINAALVYVLDYIDLNGAQTTTYIELLSDLSQTFDIDVYAGATSIYASTSGIDMTVIDEITFDVIVKTDDPRSVVEIDPANENIYFDESDSSFVKLAENATCSNDKNDAKVILYVLQDNGGAQNGTLTITFGLKFADKYFGEEKFNQTINALMNFKAETKDGSDNKYISTQVDLVARPQWLLKIDMNNYPAGKKDGTEYVPVSVPANTLTPGQVGLLVIDIYPEYSYYDELQLISSSDADGNYISFIQVAQNVTFASSNAEMINRYVELKPNTNILEKGIMLLPYSTIEFDGDNYTTSFDGRFYVNTLMGSNVKNEEEINITIVGITYQIDENGDYVLDADGNYIVSRRLEKTLAVTVNPAPEVAISNADKLYSAPIYVQNTKQGQDTYTSRGGYDLLLVGQNVNIDIELKNGLVATRNETEIHIYKSVIDEVSGREVVDYINDYVASNLNPDRLDFTIIDGKIKAGYVVTVKIVSYKTINGFTEAYASNTLKYIIVDEILSDININGSKDVLSFTVNEPEKLIAYVEYAVVDENGSLKTTIKETAEENDADLNKNINSVGGFWYGYNEKLDEYSNWSSLDAQNNIDENENNKTPTLLFENYIAYKLKSGFGIIATNNSSSASKFKVKLEYYYVATNNGLDLRVVTEREDGINDYVPYIEKEIDMKISVKTNIDEPITVYTVEDFYSMVAGRDYILMNDLYFGNLTNATLIVDEDKYSRTYTPFELNVNSFDGNMHKIHFYGNYFNTSTATSASGESTYYVNAENETVANMGLFSTIASGTIVKDLDIEYHYIGEDENSEKTAINIDANTTLTANTINFGGLAVNNNGIVSNVYVYYDGNVNINTKSSEGQVYIAGLVYQNSGKITYSSVYGPNWNNNSFKIKEIKDKTQVPFDKANTYEFKNNQYVLTEDTEYVTNKTYYRYNYEYHNVKFSSNRAGNISTFVGVNSDLISNCESECVGVESLAPASRNAKIAGFVINNSGRIYNSSSVGQRLKVDGEAADIYNVKSADNDFYIMDNLATAIGENDSRIAKINLNEKNKYFAKLLSNSNIAGFVYTNSGEIENAYANFAMETGSRTAGFVYDNSGDGSVLTSYTACYYDGAYTNNSAFAPFVGTNDLGEVLNSAETSVVKYSYYILDAKEIYEEDITFKDPASRISIDSENSDGSISSDSAYIGFDIGIDTLRDIWNRNSSYALPVLNSNMNNRTIRSGFVREYVQYEENGVTMVKFTRVSNPKNPYQIADALQFVNVFNDEAIKCDDSSAYLNHGIRLINDIDLSGYAGTDKLNYIRKLVYMGDFDGNGMIISGINLVGSEGLDENVNTGTSNVYSNVSSSFGLFKQIGTATNYEQDGNGNTSISYNFNTNNKTQVRNLTLKVSHVSKSTSTFTGILAGVVVNSDIKSVKINADGVYVLGGNAVGGLTGGIFGNSTLYNISVNASIESSYRSKANNNYNTVNQDAIDKFDVENYNFIDYSTSENNYGFGDRIDFARGIKNYSYAGGVVGIADIYDEEASLAEEEVYLTGYENTSSQLLNRTPNLKLLTVYGNVSVSAEVVGGVVGTTSEDVYLGNVTFEVSLNDSQRLAGMFTSGGIVGINNGGIIQLTKIELSQAYVDENDNKLTNSTGNTLFNVENVYPYAVGGLVGIQRGGSVITSYSKTNVISPNAKYAGGIVGYLTDYKSIYEAQIKVKNQEIKLRDTKSGSYALFEEVYTTGNVFAGDKYDSDYVIESIEGKEVKVYTPKSYVGGIVGYYRPYKVSEHDHDNFDRFNGVIGINAFHIPTNYVVSSNYSLENGKRVQYSDIMNGYNGMRTLSNDTIEYAKFLPRIGSIIGYVENIDGEFDYKNGYKDSNIYYNLYTNYIYNTTNITESICVSSKSGASINSYVGYPYDQDSNGSAINNSVLSNGIDKFKYLNNSATQQFVKVGLNGVSDNVDKTITNSMSYLILRGTGTYRTYQPNENGIYSGWDDNWIFNLSVYPKFKPTDWNKYIDIKTEAQLLEMRSGNKYRLKADIYLTKIWEAKNLDHITFVSAKRNDGLGINDSLYYAIYNININVNGVNSNTYGFFGELQHATIKNINFVYGTTLIDPNGGSQFEDSDKYGFNYVGKANRTGLLAGYITKATSISDCYIFADTSDNVTYQVELLESELNDNNKCVGGMVGLVDGSSSLNGSLMFGKLTRNGNQTTDFEATNIDASNEHNFVVINNFNSSNNQSVKKLNIGGFIGQLDSASLRGSKVAGVSINLLNKSKIIETNIGGLIGEFTAHTSGAFNIEEITILSKINVKGGANAGFEELNVGGAFGKISTTVTATINATIPSLKVDNITPLDNSQADSQMITVGGVAGYIISSTTIEQSESNNIGNIEISNVSLENSYVGGIVGYMNSSSAITNVTTDPNMEISYKLNGERNVNIGGAVGYMSNLSSVNESYAIFKEIKVSGESNYSNKKLLNIGGLIGAMSTSNAANSNDKVTKDIAKGVINLTDLTDLTINSCIGGFVGDGAATQSTSSISNVKITRSVSDVNILAAKANNAKIAGFVGNGIKSIENCISLGDIEIKNIVSGNSCVAGFIAYKDAINASNYSLTTIKAVAANSNTIYATSVDTNKNIKFNYNLSGVISKNEQDDQGNGQWNMTYSTLSHDVLNVLSNLNGTSYLDIEKGTKANPCELGDSEIGANDSNKYYVVYNSDTIDPNDNVIKNNLIANSSKSVVMVESSGFDIAGNVLVSGIAFNANSTNISKMIGNNNGYIFNCVAVGKIVADENTVRLVGFVDTNNGIINACGTNVYLDSSNKMIDSVGFVYENNGKIAYCYATNVFLNTVATNANNPNFYNVDFVVYNNQNKNGEIINSYSLPSIFDLFDKNGKILSHGSNGTISNAKNTKLSLNELDSSYNNKCLLLINDYEDLRWDTFSCLKYQYLINEAVNYGLAVPMSYTAVLGENFALGSLNTGDGTFGIWNSLDRPYKINTLFRLYYLADIFTIKFIRLVNNINAYEMVSYGITNSSVNVSNLEVFAIYNLKLENGYSLFNVEESNQNSTTLVLKNFGVVGQYDNSTLQNGGGFVINKVTNLTAINSFVSVTNNITLNYTVDYYGLLAGNVTGYANINGCFANGDITINPQNGNNTSSSERYVGTMIGKSNGGYIKNSFVSGTTIINNQNGDKPLYVGGMVGSIESTELSYNYTNVSLKNMINDQYYKNAYIGAFAGMCASEQSLVATTTRSVVWNSYFTLDGKILQPQMDNGNKDINSFNNVTFSCSFKAAQSTINSYTIDNVSGSAECTVIVDYKTTNIYDKNISLTDKLVAKVGESSDGINALNTTTYICKYDKKMLDSSSGFSTGSGTGGGPIIHNSQGSDSGFVQVFDQKNAIGFGGDTTYSITVTAVKESHVDIEPEIKLTNYENSVFESNYSDSTLGEHHHLQLQNAFHGNKIVYNVLNISDSAQTGSKMSSIKLTNAMVDYINAYDNYDLEGKYYYLDNVFKQFEKTISNGTIIGNDKLLNFTGISAFNNLQNVTISGFTINSNYKIFVYGTACYIYNLNVEGQAASDSVVCCNGSENSVFDCININVSITSSDDEFGISGLIYSSNNDIIKNVDMTASMIYTGNSGTQISGLIGNSYGTTILGDVKMNLSIDSAMRKDGYIGGITAHMTEYQSVNLYCDLSVVMNVNCQYSATFEIGGMFGMIDSGATVTTNANVNSAEINVKLASNSYCDLSTLIGRCESGNVDLNNIDISNCNGKITVENVNRLNIGGLVGYMNAENAYIGKENGSLSNRLTKKSLGLNVKIDGYKLASCNIGGLIGNLKSGKIGYLNFSGSSLFVTIDNCHEDDLTCIGGLVGLIDGGQIDHVGVNFNVEVTNKSQKSNCYVGGCVGMINGSTISVFVHSGLVAGLTYATEANNKMFVEDARTFDEGEKPSTNYKALYKFDIPIVVGGVVGYYQNGTAKNLKKIKGDVRALISSRKALDDSDIEMTTTGAKSGWNGGPSYESQTLNSEQVQARVGALCGLTKSSNVTFSGTIRKVIKQKDDFTGRAIRLLGKDNEYYGRFAQYDNAKSGYYRLNDSDLVSNIYYDFGNIDPSGSNLVDKDYDDFYGMSILKTVVINNFNFVHWYVKSEEYSTSTKLSESNFTDYNIFNSSTSDYYLQYNESYAISEVSDIDNSYLCRIDSDDNDMKSDLNGFLANANNTFIDQTNAKSANSVRIFAGYQYVNKTYNRSFWYVAGNMKKAINDNLFFYRNNLCFYPTQHWAGTYVGGVVV